MFSATAKTVLPFVFALGATSLAQNPPTAPQPTPAQTAPATPPAATSVPPRVEQVESFTVVGLTVRTNNLKEANGQGAIPQLWQNAIQNNTLDQIPNKASDGIVVVYSDYSGDNTGDYNYTLGYRVTSADKVPDGMVARTVHAGKYSAITSETGPPQEVIPALWQRIAQMTPQQLGGTRAYQTDFETYGDITDWSSMQTTAHIGLK
jgi:predicted transcriptional regulator YdeE